MSQTLPDEEKNVFVETELFNENELDEEFVRASGPGGQHRNKVQSGVRLKHIPTGLVVMATERRTQSENRRVARERLAEKLAELNAPVIPRVETKPTRASKNKRVDSKTRRSEVKSLRKIRKEDW